MSRLLQRLAAAAFIWIAGCCANGVNTSSRSHEEERIVFFGPSSAEIRSNDAYFALGYVTSLLDGDPKLHVLVVGHADDRFSLAAAQEMGFRRARAVRKVLLEHGVSQNRLLIGTPRATRKASSPMLGRRADVHVYDPIQEEISQRLGYEIDLRAE